jgi:hypothetical protein
MEDSNLAQPPHKPSGGIDIQIGVSVKNSSINVAGGDLKIGAAADAHPDAASVPPPAEHLALHRDLTAKFSLEELAGVCWELGIRFEDLPAQTLSGKARQLIETADALALVGRLREIVTRERPS